MLDRMSKAKTVTAICNTLDGFPLSFGALPGEPRIPGTPEKVELDPVAERVLRQDVRIVFHESMPKDPASWRAEPEIDEDESAATARRRKFREDATAKMLENHKAKLLARGAPRVHTFGDDEHAPADATDATDAADAEPEEPAEDLDKATVFETEKPKRRRSKRDIG